MSFLEEKMATVDEYVRMAKTAEADNAHVGTLFYYRGALEVANYGAETAPVLLEAVKYAQRLKKEKDKLAIAMWGTEALRKIQNTNLAEMINQEIAKLQATGDKNAATP